MPAFAVVLRDDHMSPRQVRGRDLDDQLSPRQIRGSGPDDHLIPRQAKGRDLSDDNLSLRLVRGLDLDDHLSPRQPRGCDLDGHFSPRQVRGLDLDDQLSPRQIRGRDSDGHFSPRQVRGRDRDDQISPRQVRGRDPGGHFSPRQVRGRDLDNQLSPRQVRGRDPEDHFSLRQVRGHDLDDYLSPRQPRGRELDDQLSPRQIKGRDMEDRFSPRQVKNRDLDDHLSPRQVRGRDLEDQLSPCQVKDRDLDVHLSPRQVRGRDLNDHVSPRQLRDRDFHYFCFSDSESKAGVRSSPATEQVSSSNITSSSSTSTTTSSLSTSDQPSGSPRDGQEVTPPENKKPTPMAFTIELGGGGTGSSDLSTSKKLDISASISKWAPKHRRNLSLTKVEEHKKVEERGGKPPVGRPRSGTIGATGLQQGRRGGGYHSEGYFSSDQDDEGPRRTELKSPRSPRTPELRSPQTPQRLVRSTSQDSAKGASLRMRTPSPDNASRSSHIMTLNESASYLIEKMMNNTPEAQRKQAGKTEGRACCKAEKKPTIAEVTGRTKSEKGNKNTIKMTPEGRKQSNSANSLSSCQTYDVKQQDKESEGGKDEKDDVSEAGTYTIEKDSSSPEVEQARNDIDRVFGISGTESEVDVTVVTPRGNAPAEELWTPTPEQDKFKSPGSISRSNPNWIQQWAAQVAEHTKSSDVKTSVGSPRGSKVPLASLSSSQESSESRPRRKLPTPPTHHPPFTMVSPKASDLSDHESPTKGQQQRQLLDSLILGKHQNDYRRDTESFLRDTEQLVTSLQARVDMNKVISTSLRGTSFESHDSGGDSDLDTSTSYPINDDDDRLMKTVGSQLKTRLKLAGIDGTSKTPPVATSPRKPDPLAMETRIKLTNQFKRERSIVSDSGYEMYTPSKEENNLHSDSSSEASEPVKDSRKSIDNNPPLKFNRAFSLRRARLASEEATQQHKSPSPVDKKKMARPSSAGNLSGSRKIPLSHSKSHQSGHTISRGGSHSQATTPKSGSNDFSRGDGGRFSLRLPNSVSSTTVSKSPSRTSVKKELSGSRRGAPRSNSTLSAKEVDFQNWKRRKNYDPMKAAAEGRKKHGDKKSDKISQGNSHNTNERSPSPPGSLLRSASFHGTEGMGVAGRWPRRPNHLYTSEDDGPCSLEEEQPHPVPRCSPLRRSPTSPHQLSSPHTTSPARQASLSSARARRASYALSDEGEGHMGSPRKTSLDESGSEGKRSPLGSTRGIVSGRSKAKMEALDNLVISTIHSLSVKVRTTSETLLQKLKSQYDEEGDRAALLEEVLAHLSESDQTLTSSQSRSTSRELAGILRNLKKIEHALEVIDRVMVCVDDDDLDEDDLDGTIGHEWGGSDY